MTTSIRRRLSDTLVEPLHARQAPKTNWTESCHANQRSLQSQRKVRVASRDLVAIGENRKGGGDARKSAALRGLMAPV
ncbi:Uncharacterized protein DAT39_011666, partial [Clarias magur]